MIDGHLNYSRLVCSVCTEPYNIVAVKLERFLTGIHGVDGLLHNPVWVSFGINYLCLLYGIYNGRRVRESIYAAQVIIYSLYAILVSTYVRIQNVEMYADAIIERRAYLYWIIQLYSSYNAYTGQYEIMAVTAALAHNLMWKEHVAALRDVNRRLLDI
jgi:hypothetical protein